MTEILKISLGSTSKSNAILVATPNTIIARSALISSPRNLLAANTPTWAPITDEIIRKNARTASTAKVVVACNNVTSAVTKIIWNNEVPITFDVGIPRK